jgi:Major Facilitator Superfamily
MSAGEKNIAPTEEHDVDDNVQNAEMNEEIQADDHSDASTVSTVENNPAENGDDPENTVVRRITTELGPPVPVPRLKRRGLFAQLTIIAEVENAKTYPRRTRWFLTAVAAVGGVAAPLGSSIFLPSLKQVAVDLNSTPTIVNLSVALYMLSMSIFPLWWSSSSELFGRRSIYIISFALFVVFNVLSAISSSIGMLIVMRLLAGGASVRSQLFSKEK